MKCNDKRKNATTSTNINDEQSSILSIIGKRTHQLMIENYKAIEINYNILVINNLLCNGKCHIVALFKEYLIVDDNSEFLKRYYTERESSIRIKKVARYYYETSVIFPNYTPLNEAKYIYKNIMRKQKVIDQQQELEEQNDDKKKKNRKITNKNVFDTLVYDDILNQSESILRIIFGINKEKKNNLENNKNENIIENSDNKSYEKIENLIEKIQNLEKKTIKPQIKIADLIKKNLLLNMPKRRNKPKLTIPNSNIRTMMDYKNKKQVLTIPTKSTSPSSTRNNNKSSSIVSRNLINNFTLTSNSSISVSHGKTKSTFSTPKIYFATQRKKRHNLLSFKSIEFNNLNNENDMLQNFFTSTISTITSPRKKTHKKIRSALGRNFINNTEENNSIYNKGRDGSKKKKSFQIKKLKELNLILKPNGVFSEKQFDIKK